MHNRRTSLALALVAALASAAPTATADPLDALQAPTWNPAIYDSETNAVTLSWQPPSDGASYVYRLYRNGALIASTTDTTYTDSISFSYTAYYVTAAHDSAESAPSLPLVIQQQSTGGGGPARQMFVIVGGPHMDTGPCEILGTDVDPGVPPDLSVVIREECIPIVGRSLSLPGLDMVGWWE